MGTYSVWIDRERRTVVEFDGTKLPRKKIIAAMKELGFSVCLNKHKKK